MASSLLIKICGIKSGPVLEAAIAAGADMVGFMHFSRSPRHVDIETLQMLISEARGRIETCVVLVNPDNSCVVEVAALGPDWIQLHGPETPHRVEAVRGDAGVAVMKAVPVGSSEDLGQIGGFIDIADRILLDAKPPKGSDRPGGLGRPFDWTLLKALDPDLPFMLSGGLTPDNVAGAVRAVRPLGIDVSSGVESAPGEKNANLIRAFIERAREAALS